MKIAFDAFRIDEEVSIASAYGNQSIRVCNQAAAGCTLVRLCSISTYSIHRSLKTKHC
jgi:hypothetical protein